MNPKQKSSSSRQPVIMISGYRGLAESFLQKFHEQNFQLSILVRKQGAVAAVAEKFPGAYCHIGDVADAQSAQGWVGTTVEKYGAIDCLLNNAAILGPVGNLADCSIDEFREAFEVNFFGPLRLIQLVIPHLSENGTVINLSGGGAAGPRPHFDAYATSKTALLRLTENLALEYPQQRFYCIAPGLLKTQLVNAVLAHDRGLIEKEFQDAERCMEKGGNDPRKAAELAHWLVTVRPQHLNGAVISAIWDDYAQLTESDAQGGWWRLRRFDQVLVKTLENRK